MSFEDKENESFSKNEEEKEKNNEINKFSRNFNKCYEKLKDSKEKINKNNNNISPNEENNINIINNLNKSNTAIKQDKNNELRNSLVEFDLINMNISDVQNTKINPKQEIKTKEKSPVKNINSYLILSSSSRGDNYISTTNIPIQTTTVQSGNIKSLKNLLNFRLKL